jgi:predicted RNA-binding protein YlqC (UPF0109 family)
MTDKEGMRDIVNSTLTPMVKAIATQPDDVFVECELSENRTLLVQVIVKKEDMGIMIGREGRTISALRVLMHAIGGKNKCRTILEVGVA